jgi:hypothetical protein
VCVRVRGAFQKKKKKKKFQKKKKKKGLSNNFYAILAAPVRIIHKTLS